MEIFNISEKERKEIDKDGVQRPVEQTRGTKLNLMIKMGEGETTKTLRSTWSALLSRTRTTTTTTTTRKITLQLWSLWHHCRQRTEQLFKVHQLTLQHKASICAMIALKHKNRCFDACPCNGTIYHCHGKNIKGEELSNTVRKHTFFVSPYS